MAQGTLSLAACAPALLKKTPSSERLSLLFGQMKNPCSDGHHIWTAVPEHHESSSFLEPREPLMALYLQT